jgi:hypothetical protein
LGFLEEIKVIPSPPIVLFGGRICIHIGGYNDIMMYVDFIVYSLYNFE